MAGRRSGWRGRIKTGTVIYVGLAPVRQHRLTAGVISAASAREPIIGLLIIHSLPSRWPVICTVAPDTNSCWGESHDDGVLWYCEHASVGLMPCHFLSASPALLQGQTVDTRSDVFTGSLGGLCCLSRGLCSLCVSFSRMICFGASCFFIMIINISRGRGHVLSIFSWDMKCSLYFIISSRYVLR